MGNNKFGTDWEGNRNGGKSHGEEMDGDIQRIRGEGDQGNGVI